MFHSIDTYAIDAVIPNKSLDPVVVSVDDPIVLCVYVDQSEFIIPEPTLLNLGLIVVVSDEAPRVKVGLLVEGIKRGEGGRRIFRGEMINHDVDHQVHIPLVQSVRESLQVFASAKMRVERKDVLWPVSNNDLSGSSSRRRWENQPMVCLPVRT